MLRLSNQVLNGISQIMLQQNRLCGILFLAGLFIGHWIYGLAALLAVLCGTLTARILKFDTKEIDSGLYGFSPALTGVVLVFLFKPVFAVWLLIIVGSVISAILQQFLIKRNFPAYTFPFILVSWVLIFLIRDMDSIPASEIETKEILSLSTDRLLIGTKSYGQVIFQSNTLAGILFFIGVLISSRAAGIYALISAFLISFLALLIGQNPESVNLGLYGFNPVLTAIVFAGIRPKDGFWVLISILITFGINLILVETDLLKAFGGVLTFPFVAGVWLSLLIQRFFQKETEK
ncbi:MAG: urea transporter [Moheibacter sp.]